VGSTDGTLYALDKQTGSLLWTFDLLDPIRSSPSIYILDSDTPQIIFGAGDGLLYSLNTNGTRRWSYNTTLQSHNDLNSSPCLGFQSVYIGSQDGSIIGVPFDYCSNGEDPACSNDPQSDLPSDGAFLYFVDSGGSSFVDAPIPLERGGVITFSLLVRRNSHTLNAQISSSSIKVVCEPEVDFEIYVQAKGQYVNLIPSQLMNADQSYNLTIIAEYGINSTDYESGVVERSFIFTTVTESSYDGDWESFESDSKSDGATTQPYSFLLRHLAPYQPPLIVSLNQIGFDSVYFLTSIAYINGNNIVFWVVGAKPSNESEMIPWVVDPSSTSRVALSGSFDGSSFIVEGPYLQLITGGPAINVDRFRLSSHLATGDSFESMMPSNWSSTTSMFAEASCFSEGIEGFGLLLFGLCNKEHQFLSVGSIDGQYYQSPASEPPQGTTFVSLDYVWWRKLVTAKFNSTQYSADQHVATILLIDVNSNQALPINYYSQTTISQDDLGNLLQIELEIPLLVSVDASTTTAIVLLDLYPIATIPLSSAVIDMSSSTD